MKIFNLGMPKTGTTSLAFALKTLGYKTLHDHESMQRMIKNLSSGITDPTFENYNAFLDFPHPGEALDVVLSIPGSKIIYTSRLSDREWINSCLVHVLHSRVTGENSWNEIDTNNLLREKLDLENRLSTLDSDRWVRFDVNSGWEPLCKFLNKPVPSVEFPKVNKSLNRLTDILRIYQVRNSISYV